MGIFLIIIRSEREVKEEMESLSTGFQYYSKDGLGVGDTSLWEEWQGPHTAVLTSTARCTGNPRKDPPCRWRRPQSHALLRGPSWDFGSPRPAPPRWAPPPRPGDRRRWHPGARPTRATPGRLPPVPTRPGTTWDSLAGSAPQTPPSLKLPRPVAAGSAARAQPMAEAADGKQEGPSRAAAAPL